MNLDDLIPHPRHRICASRLVSAAPDVVWDELHQVTMSGLPHLDAAGLRAWSQPGWIKVGMEFRLDSAREDKAR
jgi:hypothetical protein